MRHLIVTLTLFGGILCGASAVHATGLGYLTTQNTSSFPTSVPPSPIKFDVYHVSADRLSMRMIHELTVEVADSHFYPPDPIDPDVTEPLPLVLFGSDNGGEDSEGRLFPGALGMIGARAQTPPDDTFPSEVHFDFLIEASIDGKPAKIIDPEIIPDAGRYFDVLLDVEVHSNALHTVRFALSDDQPLMFVDPQVVLNENGVHVQGTLQRTDGIPMQDLFSIGFHGHYVPEPMSLALLAVGGLALFVWPARHCPSNRDFAVRVVLTKSARYSRAGSRLK